MFRLIKMLIVGIALTFNCLADSPQKKYISSTTGVASWEINTQGVNFSLTQILPEQAKAFYVNRGFTLEQTESFASSCVYMTIMRNDNAAGTIHFSQNNWSVIADNKRHTMVTVDAWLQKLKDRKVNKKALLAFRWAQFPPEQEYEVGGDWNQGMLSIGLPPGSIFDLIIRWDIKGENHQTTLREVQCAK